MVKWVSSWTQGIVIAVIISTIIEMILPNGNIKKYINTVMGVYIVFIIAAPIVTKVTGKNINLNLFEMPETNKEVTYKIDTNSYIETTYANTIENKIAQSMQEKGYNASNIAIDIEKGENEYGNINKISMKISKEQEQTNIIEPITINVNNKIESNETITDDETQKIQNFLKEEYGAKEVIINK